MVEAISNRSVEDTAIIPESPMGLTTKETVKKGECSEKSLLTDRLRGFINNGGEKKAYRQLLVTLYGKKLTDRVFPKEWKGAFTKAHCMEILKRIGHSITLDDLEEFYAELKSQAINSKILEYGYIPYLRLWWAGSVRDLPPYWIRRFLALFRDPLKETNLERNLDKTSHVDEGAILYTDYTRQLKRLQEKGDRSRPEFAYASRELLARSVAYANPHSVSTGAIVAVFNQELGREVLYTLKEQLHAGGLHLYLFVPIEKGESFPAQLIFRGTNGYASVGRDLDTKGVGKRVFAANSDKIEALIKKANVGKVEIIRHSLGAADAQRATALLIDPLRSFNFKELSLFAFCAPRLDIKTVDRWNADLKILAEQNKRPVIRLNFAYHESDAFTWAGDAYLSGTEFDFIYTNYLIVKSKAGVLQTATHHTHPFFLDGNFDFAKDGRTFQLLKSFPSSELSVELQKLEEIENLCRKEEIKKGIAEMKKQQLEIDKAEKGGSQHSWISYYGWSAVRYTVQPLAYYAFEGMRSLANWKRKEP